MLYKIPIANKIIQNNGKKGHNQQKSRNVLNWKKK